MPGVKTGGQSAVENWPVDGRGDSAIWNMLQHLCVAHPENKFPGDRAGAGKNQHELCVLGAPNSAICTSSAAGGFTNIPSLVDEITRMRLELLGVEASRRNIPNAARARPVGL